MTEQLDSDDGQPFTVGCTVVFVGPWPADSINPVASGTLGVITEMIPGITEMIPDRAQVMLFDNDGRHQSTGGLPLVCLRVFGRGRIGRKLVNLARDLFEIRQSHLLRDEDAASTDPQAEWVRRSNFESDSRFGCWVVNGRYLRQLDRERLEELAVAVDYHLSRSEPDKYERT